MHSIFDVRFWKLAKFETVTPVPMLSYQDAGESPPRCSRSRADKACCCG